MTQQKPGTQIIEHLPRIRRVVQQMAPRQGLVDDVTQECCVRLIEKEALYSPQRGSLAAWINRVTRNFTLNHLRRERVAPASVSWDHVHEDLTPTPESQTFSEEHIAWVLQQYSSLAPRQQELLRMHYFEGQSVTEIATTTGQSHQVVSYQLKTALNNLKKKARRDGLLTLFLPWTWKGLKNMNMSFVSTAVIGTISLTCVMTGVAISHNSSPSFSAIDDVAMAKTNVTPMATSSTLGITEEEDSLIQNVRPKTQLQKLEAGTPIAKDGVVLKGNITLEGKPLADTTITVTAYKHNEGGVHDVRRRGRPRLITATTDAQGQFTVRNSTGMQVASMMQVTVTPQNSQLLLPKSFFNHSKNVLTHDFKLPKSYKVHFTLNGKPYHGPVRKKFYRAGKPARLARTAQNILRPHSVSDILNNKPSQRRDGEAKGAGLPVKKGEDKTSTYLWVYDTRQVDEFGFYTAGSDEVRLTTASLKEGMTVHFKESSFPLKVVFKGLETLKEYRINASLYGSGKAAHKSAMASVKNKSTLTFDKVPGDGDYTFVYDITNKDRSFSVYKSLRGTSVEDGNNTLTVDLGNLITLSPQFGNLQVPDKATLFLSWRNQKNQLSSCRLNYTKASTTPLRSVIPVGTKVRATFKFTRFKNGKPSQPGLRNRRVKCGDHVTVQYTAVATIKAGDNPLTFKKR